MRPAKPRSVVIGILACAPGIPAMAQESSAVLEEITVTAQRREQSLKSVAKSVPNLMMQPISANPSAMQVGLRGGIEQTGGVNDLLSTGTQALSALRPREWAVNVTYRFR